jgi:hypothetical protein
MIAVLGGLADVERDLIRTRTAEGRSRAQKRGQRMGRKPKLTEAQQDEARQTAGRRCHPRRIGAQLRRRKEYDFTAGSLKRGTPSHADRDHGQGHPLCRIRNTAFGKSLDKRLRHWPRIRRWPDNYPVEYARKIESSESRIYRRIQWNFIDRLRHSANYFSSKVHQRRRIPLWRVNSPPLPFLMKAFVLQAGNARD